METIEEQSKCEEMSVSPSPSPENVRICLVGSVIDDTTTVDAAKIFGVPVITSENGIDIISDTAWITYFILNKFEGPIYEAIHKTRHRIMGPPALQKAAQMKEGLTLSSRPVYSYLMRGVITCFTGIRKKDELTRLVNLIHSMGGSIRKDMNSKVTHLICNTSGGEKYQYAMTFRLAVVRSDWVYAAWNNRNNPDFVATCETFTNAHRLKAFEGQKICFFGFPSEEHQHMVDVLRNNGGIPTDLEDPECSHVIMANMGGHFPDIIPNSHNSSPIPNIPNMEENDTELNKFNEEVKNKSNSFESLSNDERIENENNKVTSDKSEEEECVLDSQEFNKNSNEDICTLNLIKEEIKNSSQKETDLTKTDKSDDGAIFGIDFVTPEKLNINQHVTPKSKKTLPDGVILTSNKSHEFLNPNNLSPIFKTPKSIGNNFDTIHFDNISPIHEEEEQSEFFDEYHELKRKRNSFDNMSIISTDSIATTFCSAKKPKLIRTGSITRSLKRSMSFVAVVKTPISNMLRSRRNSVDPNASISSITSMESTFNESIKKPVKEKLRGIRDRITKSSKRDINITPKTAKLASSNLSTLKKLCNIKMSTSDKLKTPEKSSDCTMTSVDSTDFKTPLAPPKFNSYQFHSNRHSVCGASFSAINTTNNTLLTQTLNDDMYYLGDMTSKSRNSLAIPSATNIIDTSSSMATVVTNSAIYTSAASINNAASATISTNNECDISLCPTTVGENVAVVDEHFTQAKPEPKNNKTHIVKSDWFWYTIQNGYADEMLYLFGDYLDSIANTPGADPRRDSLPISFNKRKRKRFSQRIQSEGTTPIGIGKRRSSVSDAGLLSVSGSFLDYTTSPDKHHDTPGGKLSTEIETIVEVNPKIKSMRYNHFMDFFSTESNYVGILDTIVNLFKNPLEDKAESGNDALLNKSEVKSIFSNFIPIHEVHRQMLERLRELQVKWSEECLIGQIILEHRDDLIKAYPPYVNFFQQMKETLIQCDTQNPRFHAFLKINQAKPECGRQSLQDLMIRPVQRLPSISLLLNDILKHTNKNNPDHKNLEDALKAIKEVMAHINEDKRKTEGQLAMFDIFNDIEGCPAHLVSSHRSFISKCEVTELSETLSGRGDTLMLYLFSDTIEVCKKRSRGFNSAKSPSSTKSFKHIKLMPLSTIRYVIDICDSPRAFALNCRHNQDNKEKLYSFVIADEEIDRGVYLRSLCKQMAENACRTDTDKALISMTSQELDVDISDVNLSTLSKAFKFATRTRLKVGRAFSFNKTPSKLKRAVSTMMPSPFGSTNSLTPASQLAQMRLASCTNINEVCEEDNHHHRNNSPSTQSEVLVAPMSVQPTRKAKTSTISMAALRRL